MATTADGEVIVARDLAGHSDEAFVVVAGVPSQAGERGIHAVCCAWRTNCTSASSAKAQLTEG
jgi:hypothetical protein